MSKKIDKKFIEYGRAVLETELKAVQNLTNLLDEKFAAACHILLNCSGRIITLGMGKSGHIARKIAATFSSTGSPSFYLHPGEASHGDFGMITKQDVALAISNSGETDEILNILPMIKRLNVPLITLTGNPSSTLAKEATINLNFGTIQEACPYNLAPTASTTVSLVIGDALAIALLKAHGFTEEDFARSHPGGRLGKRLLLHVKDVMVTGNNIPKVTADIPLTEALVEMSKKSLGMTAVVDKNNKLLGMYTDGDLRRTLDRGINVHDVTIGEIMTKNPITVKAEMLAIESLQLMESQKINSFSVVDDNHHLIGAFNLHQLLRTGIA